MIRVTKSDKNAVEKINDLKKWIQSLDGIVKRYKWAQTIPIKILLESLDINYSWVIAKADIGFDDVFVLYGLLKSAKENLSTEDYNALLNAILDKLNEHYEPAPDTSDKSDDLPF